MSSTKISAPENKLEPKITVCSPTETQLIDQNNEGDSVLAKLITDIKPELYLGKVFTVSELQSRYKVIQEDKHRQQCSEAGIILGDCSYHYLLHELNTNYSQLVSVLTDCKENGYVFWKTVNFVGELNSVAMLHKEMKHVQFVSEIDLDDSPVTPKLILFYASAILSKVVGEQKLLLQKIASLNCINKEDIDDHLHKDLYNFLHYIFCKKTPQQLRKQSSISEKREADGSLHDSLLVLIHALMRFPCVRSPELSSIDKNDGKSLQIHVYYEKRQYVLNIVRSLASVKLVRQRVAKMLSLPPRSLRLRARNTRTKHLEIFRDSMLRNTTAPSIELRVSLSSGANANLAEYDECFEPDGSTNSTPIKCKRGKIPDPYIFPVNNIPRYIRRNINSGKPLNKTAISCITTTIYEHITSYVYYPSPDQYGKIITGLLTAMPGLTEGRRLPFDRIHSLWKTRLGYKFRNCRKRGDAILARQISRGRQWRTVSSLLSEEDMLYSAPSGEESMLHTEDSYDERSDDEFVEAVAQEVLHLEEEQDKKTEENEMDVPGTQQAGNTGFVETEDGQLLVRTADETPTPEPRADDDVIVSVTLGSDRHEMLLSSSAVPALSVESLAQRIREHFRLDRDKQMTLAVFDNSVYRPLRNESLPDLITAGAEIKVGFNPTQEHHPVALNDPYQWTGKSKKNRKKDTPKLVRELLLLEREALKTIDNEPLATTEITPTVESPLPPVGETYLIGDGPNRVALPSPELPDLADDHDTTEVISSASAINTSSEATATPNIAPSATSAAAHLVTPLEEPLFVDAQYIKEEIIDVKEELDDYFVASGIIADNVQQDPPQHQITLLSKDGVYRSSTLPLDRLLRADTLLALEAGPPGSLQQHHVTELLSALYTICTTADMLPNSELTNELSVSLVDALLDRLPRLPVLEQLGTRRSADVWRSRLFYHFSRAPTMPATNPPLVKQEPNLDNDTTITAVLKTNNNSTKTNVKKRPLSKQENQNSKKRRPNLMPKLILPKLGVLNSVRQYDARNFEPGDQQEHLNRDAVNTTAAAEKPGESKGSAADDTECLLTRMRSTGAEEDDTNDKPRDARQTDWEKESDLVSLRSVRMRRSSASGSRGAQF